MGLIIGERAPDFELPDHLGRRVRLWDFIGKSHVVLAFYVYANTPGWAQELRAYQAGLADFEKMGARVLGISVNKRSANFSFAQKLGITYPLLCDEEKKVSKQYGVLGFFPRLARRTTFVIDRAGVIRHIDYGQEAAAPTYALNACKLLRGF
jgi:thioredoxin-dependent peroxiredoxin